MTDDDLDMADISESENDDEVDGVWVGPDAYEGDSEEDWHEMRRPPQGAGKKRRVSPEAEQKDRAQPKGRKSHGRSTTSDFQKAKRAQRIAHEHIDRLNLRADIKLEILERILLSLKPAEVEELRGKGYMQMEWYVCRREFLRWLGKECFNAFNAIDLRACEAMPSRQMARISERLTCDEYGKRKLVCAPPTHKGAFNPLKKEHLKARGIYQERKLYMTPVFPCHAKIVAAGDRILDGRRLFLAADFDGAAWDVTGIARLLLNQLAKDDNLLPLPAQFRRVLQLIYDGHGFTSAAGAVRFVLRCPHTKRDHNATRNAYDPIFFIGTDKHLYLEKAVAIGGENSLRSHAYAGLTATELPVQEMPEHVRKEQDALDLLRIRCEAVELTAGATASGEVLGPQRSSARSTASAASGACADGKLRTFSRIT